MGAEATATVPFEQVLEHVDTSEGVRTVAGVAVPPYVIGPADMVRWVRSQWMAESTLRRPAAGDAAVQQLTRTIFGDRETYPS